MPVSAPMPVPPGGLGSTTLRSPALRQTWNWVDPVTFLYIRPTSVDFTYVATFTVTDIFGNVYPPFSSVALTVTVSVTLTKQLEADSALICLTDAMALLAVAAALAVASALAPYPEDLLLLAGAGIVAVSAFAFWGFAIVHKANADDPPVPDFRYEERVEVRPASFELRREQAPPWAEPLATLVELLERARAAQEALSLIHAKILGARVDGADDALRVQMDDYRRVLARLQAAAAEAPNAAAVTAELMANDERLSQERRPRSRSGDRAGRSTRPGRSGATTNSRRRRSKISSSARRSWNPPCRLVKR